MSLIKKNYCNDSDHHDKRLKKVYGQFIRPFTFSDLPQLPIVQPGEFFIFPIATIEPKNIEFVNRNNFVGFFIPRSKINIVLEYNIDEGGEVSVLLNGRKLFTESDPNLDYGTLKSTGSPTNYNFFIDADLDINFISIQNTGKTLFGLNDIPGTKIGSTALISKISISSL
jgi:hypothetical protein